MITKKKIWFYCFGIIEVIIGLVQCISVIKSRDIGIDSIILLSAGSLSFFLGLGLINEKVFAVRSLIFFASGVAFSKFMILGGVFSLPESSEILFSKSYENTVSIAYHLALVFFLLKHVKLND